MFISDFKPEPQSIADGIDVFQLSRPCDPYFASILEEKSVNILSNLEKSLQEDHEGSGHASDLVRAVLALSHASRVAIVAGFKTNLKDFLPGLISICQALLTLDRKVTLIAGGESAQLLSSYISHATSLGILGCQIEIMAISEATEKWEASLADCRPQWDCLVALGDGLHCHAFFTLANTNPLTNTISIGDRGTSKQAVSTDYSVAASVSNLAG